MAEFVLKYAGPRDSVRQRANQRRAAAIPPVNIGSSGIVADCHDRPALDSPMAQEIKQ